MKMRKVRGVFYPSAVTDNRNVNRRDKTSESEWACLIVPNHVQCDCFLPQLDFYIITEAVYEAQLLSRQEVVVDSESDPLALRTPSGSLADELCVILQAYRGVRSHHPGKCFQLP